MRVLNTYKARTTYGVKNAHRVTQSFSSRGSSDDIKNSFESMGQEAISPTLRRDEINRLIKKLAPEESQWTLGLNALGTFGAGLAILAEVLILPLGVALGGLSLGLGARRILELRNKILLTNEVDPDKKEDLAFLQKELKPLLKSFKLKGYKNDKADENYCSGVAVLYHLASILAEDQTQADKKAAETGKWRSLNKLEFEATKVAVAFLIAQYQGTDFLFTSDSDTPDQLKLNFGAIEAINRLREKLLLNAELKESIQPDKLLTKETVSAIGFLPPE